MTTLEQLRSLPDAERIVALERALQTALRRQDHEAARADDTSGEDWWCERWQEWTDWARAELEQAGITEPLLTRWGSHTQRRRLSALLVTKRRRRAHCVYCGWYGAPSTSDGGMTAIKQHMAACPEHPMRAVERERDLYATDAVRYKRERRACAVTADYYLGRLRTAGWLAHEAWRWIEYAREKLARAREEIELDGKLLAERDRVLDALPCPVHGRCVPGTLEQIAALREALPVVCAVDAWADADRGGDSAEENALRDALDAAPPGLLKLARGETTKGGDANAGRGCESVHRGEHVDGPASDCTSGAGERRTVSVAEPALPLCPRCGASIRGVWHCCCAEPSERRCDTCRYCDLNHDCAPWCTLHGIGVVRGECRGCRDYEAGAEPDGEESRDA